MGIIKPIQPIQPYKPDDFITGGDGHNIAYAGPIYMVKYPDKFGLNSSSSKQIVECAQWGDLGYAKVSGEMKPGREYSIKVWGEIPQWLQDKMKEVGVAINLVKKRGSQDRIESLDSLRNVRIEPVD